LMEALSKRIAVFIDAENISANYASALFAELAKRGKISFCRAYGDFSENRMKDWLAASKLHKISVFQQDQITNFKNAADMALVIGAMDIVHWGRAERFYIVSNDGDFTPLANRIKSAGFDVIGMGTASASNPFRFACNDFITLPAELPSSTASNPKPEPKMAKPEQVKKQNNAPTPKEPIPVNVREIIVDTIKSLPKDSEGVLLSKVNASLKQRIDGFAPKNYGYASISKLMNNMSEVVLTNGNKSVRLAKS